MGLSFIKIYSIVGVLLVLLLLLFKLLLLLIFVKLYYFGKYIVMLLLERTGYLLQFVYNSYSVYARSIKKLYVAKLLIVKGDAVTAGGLKVNE